MPRSFLPLSECGDWLLCPKCGEEYTHLDDVYVAGRQREDGDVTPVHVDSSGALQSGASVSLPVSDVGRRHVISIKGSCETCGAEFAIEFKQHKGVTMVSVNDTHGRPLFQPGN